MSERRLATGVLSALDALAVSVTVLAPGLAMLLNVPGVAAVAGTSTPLDFLLGGLGCLALAVVVVSFARRMASAGYAYTYVSRSLGAGPGFVAGWMYAFGMICFAPATMAGAVGLLIDLFHLPADLWFVVFLAGMALVVVAALARIKVTTRMQLLVGVVTVALIVIVDLVVTFKGGAEGHTLQPFDVAKVGHGGSGVFSGIVLGITSYVGFETAADFAEETRQPRKAIPVAVLTCVLFAIVLYLWTTYSITIGFGMSHAADFGKDPLPLMTVAQRYVGGAAGTLVELGALLACLFVCVACTTAGTRTLFAMGREGAAPAWLAVTHPKFRTPANATIVVAVLSCLLAAAAGFGFGDSGLGSRANVDFYFFVTLGTLATIVVYLGLCISAIAYFWRLRQGYNPLLHLVIPLIGIAVFGAALYGSVHPAPQHPLNLTPYLALGWLLVGIGVVSVLRLRRPDAISRIGSVLAEESGASH